ncbi:unnamed protein product [Lymnaea stagnalis]|uniref:Uncharacterized protein n=1 Tax=Lymnaea stagnalis TaxID=6523 RepID=A0AAV2H326_LYMST
MSSYHYAVRRFLSEVNKFINGTLRSESLSKPAQKERDKIIDLLLRLYADYDSLSPSGDEGSASSTRDTVANTPAADESRNTTESNQASEEDNYSDNIPDTTIKALNNPVKIGYLEKKANLLGVGALVTWKKCYCVLHKNILYSFKKPDAKKQDSAIFITGYEFREAPQLLKDASKKDGCFELVCPGKKSYQFLASSKEDLQAWKDAILATNNHTADSTDGTDENHIDDIYEEFTEPVANKKPAIATEDQDEIYDDAATDAPSKVTANLSPVTPKERLPPVPPEAEDDDLIYEAVSEMQAPPPVSSMSPSIKKPVPSSPTPPPPRSQDLPPVPSTPRSGSIAPPLPSPPADAVIPPPLPSRNAPLPPPPKEPLPEIPKAKGKTSPALAKMTHPPSEDFENMFYSRWKCDGSSTHELSFNRGEIIHVISRDFEEDNWWVGELGGKIGLVPKTFLTPAYELVH